MFEIALSPRSRFQVASTRYDSVAGTRFESRERAEEFCHDLNHFCHMQRFLVVRVGMPSPCQTAPAEAVYAMAA
ncbi:MAG TPA: hypothetical protein VN709_04495 [Terriglobales bacterium]|nr:hypothetical protein [Terriglobales bacterium]